MQGTRGTCNSYAKTVNSTEKIVIFGAIISRGIKLNAFNSCIKKGCANIKSFPAVTSKELLHYIEPTLKDDFLILPLLM